MNNKTMKTVFFGFLITGIVAVSITSLGRSNNRWNSRMEKEDLPDQKSKTTVNYSSGVKKPDDGRPAESMPPVASDVKNYGQGTLHCRDTVLKLNSKFETTDESSSVSELRVPELKHGNTRAFQCKEITPPLVNNHGYNVNGGTITVKCGNGQLHVESSNCTAPTPAPTPVVVATPTPTPAPAHPPGYSVKACDGHCSDAVYSCQVQSSGRNKENRNQKVTIRYRKCTTNRSYNVDTGKCITTPSCG